MTLYAFRLLPGQDLKLEIDRIVQRENLSAGFVITCVGSLQRINIRPANRDIPMTRDEKFEIISLVGTLSADGSHLHICLSDHECNTIGGHLLPGNLIYTTAEIVLGATRSYLFKRETDPNTGYKELVIYPGS